MVKSKNKQGSVVCMLCEQDFSGASQLEMLAHVALTHPVNFAQTSFFRNILLGIQKGAYDAGEQLGLYFRGKL
jgi:hypothetical protein